LPLSITASNQRKYNGQVVAFGSGSTQFTNTALPSGETIGSVTLTCNGGSASAAVATYPIIPSAATGGTFSASNYAIQYVAGTLTVDTAPFDIWAEDPAQGLTAGVNNGALDDPNRDGVCNLLAFVLGGAPMNSAVSVLPTLTQSGGNWIFEYDRSDVSLLGTTQVVEYGSEFGTWTPISIPATSSGSVTIIPGSPSDHVRVVVPASGAKMFMRLKVTQ
jgi:hypothetical protein